MRVLARWILAHITLYKFKLLMLLLRQLSLEWEFIIQELKFQIIGLNDILELGLSLTHELQLLLPEPLD